ncbi:SMC-Scp complex subunit ScpB [Roseovarius ramblicola]|uniref:SMC-Scp complex subunit ScpB n=1 Tax=Roseovarius ramblicola TaxID=2022336 RepID=A0ABV5I526_9RHOB
MTGARPDPGFDRELAHLPAAQRWQRWLRRIEAVLFAAAAPVPRDILALVVGRDARIEHLIADLAADLEDRAVEVAAVADGWLLRSRPAYASAVRAAIAPADDTASLRQAEAAVLAAIAWHQPITRKGLRQVFGREIGRDVIGRLHARGLIAPGPRAPRRGAPLSYVTTPHFLATFGLANLGDLPDIDDLPGTGPITGDT